MFPSVTSASPDLRLKQFLSLGRSAPGCGEDQVDRVAGPKMLAMDRREVQYPAVDRDPRPDFHPRVLVVELCLSQPRQCLYSSRETA